ncbi:hypothetical protein ACFL5Q_02690 [Planctomycetota bacterium]
MTHLRGVLACGVSVALFLGVAPDRKALADGTMLDLSADFDWAVGALRSERVVTMERAACVSFTKGENTELSAEKDSFTVVPVTLTAKKGGTVDAVIPEFFLARNEYVHRVCLGLRFLEPEPGKLTEAFHPPLKCNVWPGHAGDRIRLRAGEKLVVELLFEHLYLDKPTDILVMTSAVKLAKGMTNGMHNKRLQSDGHKAEAGQADDRESAGSDKSE